MCLERWTEEWLPQAENRINYSFRSRDRLREALTHRSYTQANQAEPNYERLEFLGDALLELVVSEELLSRFPEMDEGDLTRMRATVVSREHLFILAQRIGLGDLLRLGKGEEKTGGREKKAILADVFESLAGAIYLDGGLDPARDFVLRQLAPDLDGLAAGALPWHDHKSQLQEVLHQQGKTAPIYQVVQEDGPPHERVFTVEVEIEGQAAGLASGSSKKRAEQRAAAGALEEISAEPEM